MLEWAHNPKVRGSNPLPATKKIKGLGKALNPFLLICNSFPSLFPNLFRNSGQLRL